MFSSSPRLLSLFPCSRWALTEMRSCSIKIPPAPFPPRPPRLDHHLIKTQRQNHSPSWSLSMPGGAAAALLLIALICRFNEVWSRPDWIKRPPHTSLPHPKKAPEKRKKIINSIKLGKLRPGAGFEWTAARRRWRGGATQCVSTLPPQKKKIKKTDSHINVLDILFFSWQLLLFKVFLFFNVWTWA